MKDQYFGDARDYLKYHLLEELYRSVPGTQRLTILWMLTPPDGTNEGNVKFLPNDEVRELSDFLRVRLEIGDRRVRHMRDYFAQQGIEYVPVGDDRPYFTHNTRRGYFASIPDGALDNAVVFLDPDNGMSAEPTAKHLGFDELSTLWSRCGATSVVVIYQHAARIRDQWNVRASALRAATHAPIGWVRDKDVALYVAARNEAGRAYVNAVLSRVASAAAGRVAEPIS